MVPVVPLEGPLIPVPLVAVVSCTAMRCFFRSLWIIDALWLMICFPLLPLELPVTSLIVELALKLCLLMNRLVLSQLGFGGVALGALITLVRILLGIMCIHVVLKGRRISVEFLADLALVFGLPQMPLPKMILHPGRTCSASHTPYSPDLWI